MSIAATLYDAIPYGEEYRWGGPGKTLLFDLACRLAPRVPLIKLVKLDGDVCPYLAPLIVPTLVCVGETLVTLEGMQITMIIREAFNNMILKEAGCNYNNYRLVSK